MHYMMLSHAPRIMKVMLNGVIGVGVCGHLVKLYKPNESNYLFDGASLVLYMIAVVLYGTSIMKGTAGKRGNILMQRVEEYQ
jgi:predicted membrane channel-forming protein YqfA (hemolysin III family)